MKKAVDAGNYPKYSELNVKFHMSIYEATPYTELYNMIQDLWRKWSITRSVFAVDPNRMQESTRGTRGDHPAAGGAAVRSGGAVCPPA